MSLKAMPAIVLTATTEYLEAEKAREAGYTFDPDSLPAAKKATPHNR